MTGLSLTSRDAILRFTPHDKRLVRRLGAKLVHR